MLFALTKQQQEYYEAVEWLIGDNNKNIAVGKTTLMAFVFLEKALQNGGKYVYVFDHYPRSKRNILNAIEKIFGTLKIENKHLDINISEMKFRVVYDLTVV